MINNYLKIALRSLRRHKLFSFINIFGLALSLSFCLLVLVIINDQNSFDRFHPREDDVYRVLTAAHRKNGDTEKYASSPRPLGDVLKTDAPSVESVVQLTRGLSGDARHGQVTISLSGFFTDRAFFDIFGFELAHGDPETALSSPNSVVLTFETAQKIFGNNSALGKTVTVVDLADFVVTGVLRPFPGKTHLEFDALGSALSLPALEEEEKVFPTLKRWKNYYTNYNYLRLHTNHQPEGLVSLLEVIPQNYYGDLELESRDQSYSFELQPLTEITPGPRLSNSMGNALPDTMLVFLSILALIGMLAAVFNYTSLTLARSLTRAKEVGIRKVTGAVRRQLFVQFLGESVLIVLLAIVAAEPLLRTVLIPGFEQLQFAQSLDIDFVIDGKVYLFFLGFAVTVGVIAGLLPAAMISAFRPTQVLKDISQMRVFSKITLRKALIVFQFALSMVLIIVVTAVDKQISYALEMDYGFTRENMINIPLQGNDHQLVTQKMIQHPDVASYAIVSHNMGTWEDSSIDVRKAEDDEPVGIRDYSVDARFVEHFGLKLAAGSNFAPAEPAHNEKLVLVNERFVEKFELGTPHEALGQTLILDESTEVQIAGVLQDFIFKPVTYTLQPMLLRHHPHRWRTLNIRIHGKDTAGALAYFENAWKSIDPVHQFEFNFYDHILQEVYRTFRDMTYIVGFLSLLAFVIALLGLLGMATFNAESKIKEVGIRKVLGAGIRNLVVLLSRNDAVLLVVATIIAVPISLLLVNQLLQTFAYRIDVGFGVILPGVLSVFLLAGLTTGWQALRAALTNPVEALRYE